MATKTKHKERSKRSYRQKEANLLGFSHITFKKAEQKKQAKENKSSFVNLLGNFRKTKGDR